jgi:hypothetical protein
MCGTETAPPMKARKARYATGVAMRRCIVLVLLFSSWMARQRINAQTVPDSSANAGSNTNSNFAGAPKPAGNGDSNDSLDWLFPITRVNQSLPRWFHTGPSIFADDEPEFVRRPLVDKQFTFPTLISTPSPFFDRPSR